MCKAYIRQCPHCGFSRDWYYDNCKTWLDLQEECALLGKRMPISPHECPEEVELAEDGVWLFPYPALQCGNEECSSHRHARRVQAKCVRIAEEKKKKEEEVKRKVREEKERQQAVFAKKYFRKLPVLSIAEQEKAWNEMIEQKERAAAARRESRNS